MSIDGELQVRGPATGEDLAAVLAALLVLAAPPGGPVELGGYDAWRRVRLAALRRSTLAP